MAKKETIDNEAMEADTALTIRSDQEIALDAPQAFVPSLREQVELDAELASLRQALEDGLGDTTKPSDLADKDVVFDIYDAYLTTMRDDLGEEKDKVVFRVVEQGTGIEHKVMQSDDKKGIRRRYAALFSLCKARGIPTEPLVGYHFIYGNKMIAGNRAIILDRVRAQVQRTV